MFCPLCKAEYRQGFTRCADCDVELVPALEAETAAESGGPVVVLWQGEDPVLFGAITAALAEAEIEFYERQGEDEDISYSRPFPVKLLSSGSFEVRVFQRDLAAARDVVQELEGMPPEEQS